MKNPKSIIFAVVFVFLASSGSFAKESSSEKNYLNNDFSSLLNPRTEFLGLIGADYQRLYIKYDSVMQNPEDKSQYLVKGETRVKSNVCSFEGKIIVDRIALDDDLKLGVDDEYKGKVKANGVLEGSYKFYEEKDHSGCGVFSGEMKLNWYADMNDKIQYDDIESYTDGYSNNQYEGTWSSYKNQNVKKVANWGEYRIPASGDLDVGAAEFIPSEKYYKFGWESYARLFLQ